MVAALERAWAAIRARHPDVPAVVLVIAPGSIGHGQLKLGHFAAMRWVTASGDASAFPEVLVGGEGLARGPAAVLGTLLHEATHALAHVRGIKDTSRQGRWHNTQFRDLGESLGLELQKSQQIGWSITDVPEPTRDAYADTITDLGQVLTYWRRREGLAGVIGPTGPTGPNGPGGTSGPGGPGPTKKPGTAAFLCACTPPRRIRATPSTVDLGPITCGLCDTGFAQAS